MKFAAVVLLVVGCTLGPASIFSTSASVAVAQEADTDVDSFDFDLPEGSDSFGEESFELDTRMTAEEAAAGAMMAAGLTALCTSLPALLLGLAIGYFLGKRRSAPPPTA